MIALAWRVLIDRVQTRIDLARKNVLLVNVALACGLCAIEEEYSSQHLFFSCVVAWQVWMKLYGWLGLQTVIAREA